MTQTEEKYEKICTTWEEMNLQNVCAREAAAKLGVSIDGATLYCTHQPCSMCCKMIINSGIKRVIYKEGYPDPFTLELFAEAGVKLERYEDEISH